MARDSREEIFALITTLHETGQRLEHLTAGEVDSVSDSEGRTFLLRNAQEWLRHIDAAKQAALLNALPANIALIDARGVITSVNTAWQHASPVNVPYRPGYAVGVDYLAICENAQGASAAEAHRAAGGLRSVLSGTAKHFSLEYSCRLTSKNRWYLMNVSPLSDERATGAVVMHIDVTEKRKTEQGLRLSEARFGQMAESIRDVFFLCDSGDGRVRYLSPAYEKIWDRSSDSHHIESVLCGADVHPEDRLTAHERLKTGLQAGAFEFEYRIVRADGSTRWIECRAFPVRDAAGAIVRIAGVAADITVRKLAVLGIQRLNRVYAVLSQINALIVRVRDRDELFNEACRIATDTGGLRLAWIGIVDSNSQIIAPIALAGSEGLQAGTDSRRMLQQSALSDAGPASLAARTCKTVVINDIEIDSRMVDRRAHLDLGVRSLIVLPLVIADVAAAVLCLYASEADFFDDAEMRLLHELASDVAFAIDHIGKQERLDYLAYYDALTGLANRSLLLERMRQHMKTAAAAGHALAVVLIDLERFKNMNDSLGRSVGDAVLRHVAEVLTLSTGDAALIARMGADHFVLMLPDVKDETEAARQLEKSIATLLAHPFQANHDVIRITAKSGVALFPQDGNTADALLRNAEAALKKAKAGGDHYLFYAQEMSAAVAGKLALENQLRQALERNEFVLYYQPKMNFASGKLASAEALIRWNNPRAGLMSPDQFIPVLEETGLISEVGRWALRSAIDDHLRWRNAGMPALRIAVNISALQLRSRGFIAEIEQVTSIDAFAAAGLEIEITESLVMADVENSIATLQAIRAMGITIAIDDFGTGFSSLSYLAKLPVDTLKIDRSFVINMTLSSEGLALVSTIITLAHSLKLKVVAEGVETEEQRRLLRLLNCDELQGYIFSKPLPADVFETRFLAPLSLVATS